MEDGRRRGGWVLATVAAAAGGVGIGWALRDANEPPPTVQPGQARPLATAEPPRPLAPPPRPVPEPFRYAADRAGRLTEKALTPPVTIDPPAKTTAPRPWSSAVTRGELPQPRLTPALPPPAPLPDRPPSQPAPPAERLAIGRPVGDELPEVKFPVSPGAREEPPKPAGLPPLARRVQDRIPTADPTADLSAALIVLTRLAPPIVSLPLAGLGGHGRLPAAPEVATTPVAVPPARP
jgi:hypothetical protein